MKSKAKSSRVADQYDLIEMLEPRIAPAAVISASLPANVHPVTAVAGANILLTAGEVLTTGAGGGGAYLLYVQQGQVMVHTTDLNGNSQLDYNEITGLSVGAGASIVCFVDIHGDVVTDLNPNGTLTDNGKGDVLLDANIAGIDMRSLTTADFVGTSVQTPADLVNAHLAMSDYSIFGNIYAGGGVGQANNTNSGIQIDTSGYTLQALIFTADNGTDIFPATPPIPTIGSIYAGDSASGQSFNFGATGSASDLIGTILPFKAANGEAGASIYNISSAAIGMDFGIGTIHAGDGGFNAPGGSIVNVALQGDNAGTYQLIAGNAGTGTAGQAGGSILNFSEAGAIIGEVVLQSGSGGTGLTGSGGNAGQITFGSGGVHLYAHVVLDYGSGGDGYTKGGAGGSSPSGSFITPDGQATTGQDVVTTMHTVGSIGSNTPFDFNGDGMSDAVFSTNNPDMVVVALGNGSSNYFNLPSSDYIYLNAPAQVDSIVVGDFTGNGHPDIAVASGASTTGTFAGIEVFLSQYNPKTGAFEGFSAPLYTPIPSFGGLAEGIVSPVGHYQADIITNLVAGNFSGPVTENGHTYAPLDLAVLDEAQGGMLFLTAETTASSPDGTGYFYAKLTNETPYAGLPFIIENPGTYIATALQQFTPGTPGSYDVIIGTSPVSASNGSTSVNPNGFVVISDNSGLPGGFPAVIGTGSYGYIDTNRTTTLPHTITEAPFIGLTLAVIQDPTTPTIADVVALSSSPVDYFATFIGNGNGTFKLQSGATSIVDDYAYAGLNFYVPPPGGTSSPVAMVTVPSASGYYSSVAVLDSATGTITTYSFDSTLTIATPGAKWGVAPTPGVSIETGISNYAFDVFYPVTTASSGAGSKSYGFLTAGEPPPPAVPPAYFQGFVEGQPGGGNNYTSFKDDGYFFYGGAGGNSLSGSGGAGGSIGESLTITGSGQYAVGTGTLDIVFPKDPFYVGDASFTGGNGGNGFTSGGTGGDVNGVSVTYEVGTSILTGSAELMAGNGGTGLIGAGGNGGSLSQMYIITGDYFSAGNGGIGTIGGSGGSLYGNTQLGVITGETNNYSTGIDLIAGNGATGITGGGNGGSIVSFVNEFPSVPGATGGLLFYEAGYAGNAVAGQAGTGGSILNSGPDSIDNHLAGDIYLEAGAGGSGLYAGSGGSIVNFDNVSTFKDNPTSSTILAGAGGNATLGAGGSGGSIYNVQVAASGLGVDIDVSYNRMIAGQGGSSQGGAGGAGGAILDVNTTSTAPTSQNFVSAGAGGNGLTAGGLGGSVVNAIVDAGTQAGQGKVVVVAGDGGISYSGKPLNPNSPADIAMSFGAVNGPGGNGGSIIDFAQQGNVNANVDLIAGNGGATPDHSVAFGNATADNSGKGGSMSNISVTGSIGDSDPNAPIVSYNNIYTGVTSNGVETGTTMQDFIDNYVIADYYLPLTDAIGNVGLVAGAAGSVESSLGPGAALQPSSSGVNGSVYDVHAENIMSMVAGNVDLVAAIQSLTDYGVTEANGIVGAAKEVYYNPITNTVESITVLGGIYGNLNYISGGYPSSVPAGGLVNTPLPGGGQLIDGAFYASNVRTGSILGPRDFNGTEG